MLGSDNDAVVADVVTSVADDENLGGSDTAEGLVTVGIAKCDNCMQSARAVRAGDVQLTGTDSGRSCGSESLCCSVHKLSTLAVARNHDFSGWASGDGLFVNQQACGSEGDSAYRVDQIEHGRSTISITSSQEATNARRVCYALDSQAAGSTQSAGKSVEESRPFTVGRSDITLLSGAAGIDDSNGTASSTISQLVVGVAAVLALGQCDLLRYIAGLKLLSILLDGEASVDDICDWEADSVLLGNWCWGSKGRAEQGSEGK